MWRFAPSAPVPTAPNPGPAGARRRPLRAVLSLGLLGTLVALPAVADPAPQRPTLQVKPKAQLELKVRTVDDRLRAGRTAWWWYHGVSPDFISARLKEHGARIVDLEIESASPPRFSVVMVENVGAWASSWWWYYGLAGVGTVADKVADHPQARLIDLEHVEVDRDGGKGPWYAVVLVGNTGANERSWWRAFNDPLSSVKSSIDEHGARLIDLEENRSAVVPGRWGAVLLANQGAERRAWWWYVNVTPSYVAARLKEHDARLVDIEPAGDGRFHVVMVRRTGEAWWWYYGLTADALADRLREHRARLIDIEPYGTGGAKRFAAILVEN